MSQQQQQQPVTNVIYIASLGSQEELDFARKLLNLKKVDGVNVFQSIAVIQLTDPQNDKGNDN